MHSSSNILCSQRKVRLEPRYLYRLPYSLKLIALIPICHTPKYQSIGVTGLVSSLHSRCK
ncbi:hypothetical protein Hanom_Chr06g00560161 [Helianthus anomalus]